MTVDPTPDAPQTDSPDNASPAATPDQKPPSFGWNTYAERINGRFAMIGFVALLVLEAVTHQTFFAWIGLL